MQFIIIPVCAEKAPHAITSAGTLDATVTVFALRSIQ
jgi:hypothetical protein